jgi:alpha(1,3/1,4) fucosyltransferase
VRPCYDVALNNKLFSPADERAAHWNAPYHQLRERARVLGVEIDTWDVRPVEQADVVLVQDLPPLRATVAQARRRAPAGTPFVLLQYESPVDRSHYLHPGNHDLFDAVLTYDGRMADGRRYFHFRLPTGLPPTRPAPLPFAARKPLVMINQNRYSGFLAPRQHGKAGIPVFGPCLGGWKVDCRRWWNFEHNCLYPARRALARLAGELAASRGNDVMDVFGSGWRGDRIALHHKLFPPAPFAVARGPAGDKLETMAKYRFGIAYENVRADIGYVSEKLFDCLFAGVVPIYLGDTGIAREVPPEVFVDARDFAGPGELLEFVLTCPESRWRSYIEAGQRFLYSPAVEPFLTDAFVARVLHVIATVARNGAR